MIHSHRVNQSGAVAMRRPLQGAIGQVLGVVGLLTVAACAGVPIKGAGGKIMQVELDVFSGRPNPHWDLTPQEEQEFLKRLRSVPKGTGGASVRDRLGYRGLIVTAGGQAIDGFDEVVVSEGIVLGRRAGGVQVFTDKARSLERWLFSTGKGHIAPDLYGEISKEF
jgi:hypothetical protein